MDLTPYLQASGERILKGVTGKVHGGKGEIFIAKAAVIGIDRHLMALQMAVVDELGIAMSLNSLDTGQGEHVPGSRHFDGRADDCNLMGAKGGPLMPATLLNRYTKRYVELLLAHGFRAGEGGPHAAILWGPVGTQYNPSKKSHLTHVHTSIFKRALPGAPAGEEEDVDSCGEAGEEKSSEEEGERSKEVVKKVGCCLYPATQAAAFRRIAFPPPFPPPKPRWAP